MRNTNTQPSAFYKAQTQKEKPDMGIREIRKRRFLYFTVLKTMLQVKGDESGKQTKRKRKEKMT